MSQILIVGRGFIGQAVASALGPREAVLIDHETAASLPSLHGVSSVVYAGRHPALGTDAWTLEADLELHVARAAAKAQASLLTLGTRKVYAPSSSPLAETDRIGPTDLYGKQKLQLEHALMKALGPRLTRLRLANIFGYEIEQRRSTFLSQALGGLARRDEIRFDMSPFVTRDFLPIDLCARWLAELARRPPGGVVNVGSGVPLPTGRLALWLIQGFGRGKLIIESPEERDSFVLDVRHLRGLLGGVGCSMEELRSRLIRIGQDLRARLERR